MLKARALDGYSFLDYATQGYLLVVALLVLCFHGETVPGWPVFLLGNVGVMVLLHWLIRFHGRSRRTGILGFLRQFYPILLYTGLYREAEELNRMFVGEYLDPFFIRLEGELFGCQPSLELMTLLPSRSVGELLYGAYFSYYVMIVGVGLALFRRNREAFCRYLSVVSFVFYVCYLCYIFLPVVGPRIFYGACSDCRLPEELQPGAVPGYPGAVQSAFFFRVMAVIYRVFEGKGAAFPSSHVAVAITTLYFSFVYLRSVRWLHLLAVVLLCVATVYCRYHYLVDVVGGLLTAAVLIPLGDRLYANYLALNSSRMPLR